MGDHQNPLHHTVTVTVTAPDHPNDRPEVDISFVCTAPEDAPCRTYPDCSCEAFTEDEGNPGHDDYGHPYITGQPCWVGEWFSAFDKSVVYVGPDATDLYDHGHPATARTGSVHVLGGGLDGYIEWEWWQERRTPDEWCKRCGLTILDPDGWDRRNFAGDWARPLTWAEFRDKAWASTAQGPRHWDEP